LPKFASEIHPEFYPVCYDSGFQFLKPLRCKKYATNSLRWLRWILWLLWRISL